MKRFCWKKDDEDFKEDWKKNKLVLIDFICDLWMFLLINVFNGFLKLENKLIKRE